MTRPTVAIIEDDAMMAYLLEEVCKTAGCDVLGRATRAREGLELIAERRPDLLILDFNLGGRRNGLQLLTEAKQLVPDVFSILITAWDINDIASRIECAQPDRILRKPVMAHVLIDLLEATAAARTMHVQRAASRGSKA